MPYFINTYSKSRPVMKAAGDDAFSELQQYRSTSRHKCAAALEKISENQSGDEDEDDHKVQKLHTSTTTSKKVQTFKHEPSRRKQTPVALLGRQTGRVKFSPVVTTHPSNESDDDDSILYLSDFSEECSTLSDADTTLTNTGTQDDSYSRYSDIEIPRDLPDPKRKSRTTSSRILKLSTISNIQPSSNLKSHVKVNKKTDRPVNSTLLEGKFSAMDIDQYEISDIPGDGAECCVSESSMLHFDENSDMQKKLTRKHFSAHSSQTRPKPSINKERSHTTAKSVYSLESSENVTDLQSPLQKQEPRLKVTGKKVPLTKKKPGRPGTVNQSCLDNESTQGGKKQVSFVLQYKPKIFDPLDPSSDASSSNQQPPKQPSTSILKKKDLRGSQTSSPRATRATSTPQKSSRSSRKAYGCHIMDLSFDISAVSLPMDNDLIISQDPKNDDKATKQVTQGTGLKHNDITEKLLEFEPICLQASGNIGSLLRETPVKDCGKGTRQSEVTPSMQVKRSSPDADTPSKQLAKKSRIIKQGQDARLNNRKRLDYRQPLSSNPIPECVITTLPFTGYKEGSQPRVPHSSPTQEPLDLENILQDVLETIPERAYWLYSSSAI